MIRLVLGTRNKKKLGELADLLRDLPITLSDLTPWPELPDVDETGTTFGENAAIKAAGYASATGCWTLAEDSGLVVPALDGRPGIHSARFAGRHGDDSANNRKLLALLDAESGTDRSAHYVCSAALSSPAGLITDRAEGRCHGRIIRDYRGSGGFGYDPLFEIPEYHRTFGELSLRVKQALSHRAKAIVQLRPAIRRMIRSIDGESA